MIHISGSITGPPLRPLKYPEGFDYTSFQRGVQTCLLFLVFWLENRRLEKRTVAMPLFEIWVVVVVRGCWY